MQIEKKPRQLSTLTKVMLSIFSALLVTMAVISVLERVGYYLIRTEVSLLGLLLIPFFLLCWGCIVLFRKLRNKWARILGGFGMMFVLVLIVEFALTYAAQFAQLTLPSKYSVITSESGRKAVVMQMIDSGFGEGEEAMMAANERMNERFEYLKANDLIAEELEEGEYPLASFGYTYRAYPVKAGIFFHKKADVEGTVYRGYESEAKLLYEWTDENTLRLYLENPEVGDSGEVVVKY